MPLIENFHQKHPHIGHYLFIIGAFSLLFSFTLLAPFNVSSRAFGTSDIISLSNQARTRFSKYQLEQNIKLMNAAQMKAEDMAKIRYFAHNAPDGTQAWDYIKKVSYTYEMAGENLAITNESAEDVINGWLNSPTHRDNLLSEDFKDFGIGLAYYGDYENHKNTYVIVAMYGKPAAVQEVAAQTNPSGTTTVLKPRFTSIPPTAIALGAGLLMLLGALFELRHLKKLHHSTTL
jgi:hypothetical protein